MSRHPAVLAEGDAGHGAAVGDAAVPLASDDPRLLAA